MIARGEADAGLELLRRAQACYEREGYESFAPEILEKLNARIVELTE
jgi:hypothetical protein